MRYVYVGNFVDVPNWGCRSTGNALTEILSRDHQVTEDVASETLLNTGWDAFATDPVRYGGLLPPKVSRAAWKIRTQVPRAFRWIQSVDKALGARHDFVSSSFEESIRQFHKARGSNPRLQQILDAVRDSDAVVVNGEGTMIFSNPVRRDVLFTNFIIALALDLGKSAFVLNAMFAECPQTGLNERTLAETVSLLNRCTGVACRERSSFDFLRKHGCTARLATIPDALFSWSDRARTLRTQLSAFEKGMLPFGSGQLDDQFNFSKPYICVGGSSSVMRMGEAAAVESYKMLVRALKAVVPEVYILQTCYWDGFLKEVAGQTDTKFVPQSIPVMMGAAILAGAQLFVSGRYHPAILASLGGTPCLFMAANSHKTTSLQATLGYQAQRTYSELPTSEDAEFLANQAVGEIAQSEVSRRRILETVAVRSSQTARFVDFVNGSEVGQLV